MWPLLLVFASPHIVSAVLTRLNLSSSDVSSGRAVFTPPYDYDSHITASAVTSPSYYTPAMHYHQYEGKCGREPGSVHWLGSIAKRLPDARSERGTLVTTAIRRFNELGESGTEC
jgi:hypothetical protein